MVTDVTSRPYRARRGILNLHVSSPMWKSGGAILNINITVKGVLISQREIRLVVIKCMLSIWGIPKGFGG